VIDFHDEAVISAQLGRPPRSLHDIAHRCPCGNPDVVSTEPRLEDGTPFPTTFYLTCPRAASLIGTLEASGLMRQMSERLEVDGELAAAYQRAHEVYLDHRERIGHVPEIAGVSAGGMPTRVKCLHVLAGQALAQGPGVNPLGDEVVDRLGDYWAPGPCVRPEGPAVRRVGAIDCGTNTIKLLVADLDRGTGEQRELVREMRMVRLGQGVDRTGQLADEALVRVFAAVDEYAAILARHPVEALRFCATSAARDAQNAGVFEAGVLERLGVAPEVVSGAEEAQLAYGGVTRSLAGRDVPGPIVVVDIGGGSTELILGDPTTGQVQAARSLDVGSVRLTERLLPSDPPSAAEVAAAEATVDAALDELAGDGVHVEHARTLIGVAGTITTVAATVLDLPGYDRRAIHHATLPVTAVHAAAARLLAMTHGERRALPYMHPGRADVIGAGALILDRVLRRARVETLLVSEADILDGIAWSLV